MPARPAHLHRNGTWLLVVTVTVVALALANVTAAPRAQATTWSGTVTLSSPRTTLTSNDDAVTMQLTWSPTSTWPAAVVVYDESWHRVFYSTGGTYGGSLTVQPAVNTSHTYTAYVAGSWPDLGPPTDVLAASSAVTISNVGYVGTVSLSAPSPTVTADNPSQTLSLSASPGVVSPYVLSVYDDLGNRVFENLGYTYSGSLNVSPAIGATRTYTAYLAQDAPNPGPPSTDVRATASTTVTNLGFTGTIGLATDLHQLDSTHTSAHLTVTTSAPVGFGLTTSVYDDLGTRVWYSGFGTSSGSLTVSVPAGSTRTYTAYVSQGAPTPGPPTAVFAASGGVYVTDIPAADNVLGLSLVTLSSAATARYGADITEGCVLAGEIDPIRTNGSSVPDATVACLAGGVRGLAANLVVTLGATEAAAVLWQVVFGGDPTVNTAGGAATTTLPPPAPADPTQDEPMVTALQGQLLDRIVNLGNGPVPARIPNPDQMKVIAENCLNQARAGGADALDCETSTILVPGKDAEGASLNDAAAISKGWPWRLHYVSGANQSLRRGSYLDCAGPQADPTYQCDEYPYYTTNEAGPPNSYNPLGPRMVWVPKGQNSAQAPVLNWMPTHCGFTSGYSPSGPRGTHYLVVPMPELPVSTYICGSDLSTDEP